MANEFKTFKMGDKHCNLYYHKTDGGAEYLSDTYIKCPNGHREGTVNLDTAVLVRIDGDELEIMRVEGEWD